MATERKNTILVAGISSITFENKEGVVETRRRFHVTSILGPSLGLWVTSPGSFVGRVYRLKTPVTTSQAAAKALLEQFGKEFTKAELTFLTEKSTEKVAPVKAPKAPKGETKVTIPAPTKKLTNAEAEKVKTANLAKLKQVMADRKASKKGSETATPVAVEPEKVIA